MRLRKTFAPPLLITACVAAYGCSSSDNRKANELPVLETDASTPWTPGTGGAGGTGGGGSAGFDISDAGQQPVTDAMSNADVRRKSDAAREGCGDGVIQPGEGCDDGNSKSGDGCSATCVVENDWVCPIPGKPCVSTVKCGDGRIDGKEQCDDGSTAAGDGCSATCMVEDGWTCLAAGTKCQPKCGDGKIVGNEICDDGNVTPGDGCSATCTLETGWACDTPGQACHKTTCGDAKKEGTEPCDNGANKPGSGCSPGCAIEPVCPTTGGACHSSCGDGMILPGDNEKCDDGNSRPGDGCSATCQVEPGWSCTVDTSTLPTALDIPVVYRDFISIPAGTGVRHPDFEASFAGTGATTGLVSNDLSTDSPGKPVWNSVCIVPPLVSGPGSACPFGSMTTTKENFDQWYRDTQDVNLAYIDKITLPQIAAGNYQISDNDFFPLDTRGWVTAGKESLYAAFPHNYGFTTEIHYWFEYNPPAGGGPTLTFYGDDDVWVFINRKLAVDLGGLHTQTQGSVILSDAAPKLGLTAGNIYEIAFFHAERHTVASNFQLTMNGFVSAKSTCKTICGDAIVAGNEVCDDGKNDGSYNSCMPNCTLGPRCGDKTVQKDFGEECDDGVNLTTYSPTTTPGCGPGCKLSPYCGDKIVDSLFGEECDDGTNAGGYNQCAAGCLLGPRCGDGVMQDPIETCDDGNTVSGDGCSSKCLIEGTIK